MTNEQMISYFKNGMEQGQITRIADVAITKNGEVQIKGDYIKKLSEGYRCNDCGQVICRFRTNGDTVLAMDAKYTGTKNGREYDYSLKTSYEVVIVGDKPYIQRLELDSRTNEIKEVCYKSYSDKLGSYENTVNYAVNSDEARYVESQAKRK